ncbi:MAG: hemolysin family protein [Lachnospiraceae bacterium]|nr:hemolysin family protein [Lachnospiraceae bacterium]
MDDGVAGSIIWFMILLLLEMLFYGFGSAFSNMKGAEKEETDGEEAGRLGKKQTRLAYLTEHHTQYAGAIQLGAVTVNLLFGALYLYRLNSYVGYIVYQAAERNIGNLVEWHVTLFAILTAILVTLFMLYIVMTFGVSIPKKAASRNPDIWLGIFVTPIYYYVRLTAPLTALVSITANGFLRLFGINVSGDKSDVTEEEILSMVNVGHEQGILQANEAEMISNIFEYGDKEAKDIMINRNNMIGIECTMTLQEAAAFIVDAHNSRFPVYDGTIDHIVGILHLKDVMRMQMNDKMKNKPIGKIRGLLREPRFITEKRKIDDLFRVMQTEKIQMVIVIDEYGQTAGLVALEDILEEIVGNIEDEYDEEASYISRNGADGYVIQGKMPLEELEEQLKINFEEEPFDTVNGFVISRLEHIPEEGEDFEFDYEGYTFRILEVKDRMIQTVLARRQAEVSGTERD